MPFVDSFKLKILNSIFNNAPINMGNIWIAILTTLPDPINNIDAVELTDPNYNRIAGIFTVDNQNIWANIGSIILPAASNDWGYLTGFGLYDSNTNGNIIYYDTFNDIINIKSGDLFMIDHINIKIV